MTHLKIEQNTTGIEEVSHSIIEKLYNLAISGDLDASSNLLGRLHTSATYRSYIDYLTTNYPNLYITSSDYYVNFADPEVRRIFALSNYGDGFGLLLSTALTITDLNNVTISGTGNLFKNNTTIEHFDELGLFTSVTRLTMAPFYGTTNLKSIDLSNILFINQECFRNSGLTGTINLPNLTETQPYPFHSCNSITRLNFSSSLTSPGTGLCAYMTGLQTVTGLSHLTSIPGAMCADDSSLSSIDIDWSKITYIGDTAFLYCTSLSIPNLSIPNLTNILVNVFKGCTGLLKVSDLGSITTMPLECFKDCTNLTEIALPSTLTAINHGAFTNCTNLVINDINLPNLTTLGNQAFYGTKIKKASDLGSIGSVGEHCFYNCTNLTKVVLPSTCTTIKHHAFYDCSSLTEAVLPSTCTTIGDYAFRGCSNLTSINLDGVTTIEYSGGMLTCEAFNGCSSLQTIIAPQLLAITGIVFANCTNLKIAIAKNLLYSRRSTLVFYNCPALKAVIFPSMCNLYQNGPGFNINGDAFHQEGILANATNVELVEYGDVSSIGKGSSGGGIKMISSLRALVLKGDTIPTLSGWTSGEPITNWFANSSITIYVKDSLLSTYQSDTTWSEYYSANIKGLSQYNPADYLSSELLQIYNSAMNTSYTAS